jgi:hypothetical protein
MTARVRTAVWWTVVTGLWFLFCYQAAPAPWFAGLGGLAIGAATVLITVGIALARAQISGRK